MTVKESIELYEHEMLNEIFHNVNDDALQDILIDAVKSVSATVLETFEAEENSK